MEITGFAFFAALAIVGLGIAAFGSALGQGRAAAAAMEAIGRQPEASGDLRTSMLLALAFTEALTLFVFAMIFILMGQV